MNELVDFSMVQYAVIEALQTERLLLSRGGCSEYGDSPPSCRRLKEMQLMAARPLATGLL